MNSRLQVAFVVASILLTGLASHSQANDESAQEFRVAWEVHSAASPVAPDQQARMDRVDRLVVLERKRGVVYAPRQTRPEVGAGQIVVTVEDAAGNEKGRSIVPDPRILRAEIPDETGQLQGVELVRPNAEFLVTLPDDPSIRVLRIYEPRWNGSEFQLDLVGTMELD